jgi:hypothetical protein
VLRNNIDILIAHNTSSVQFHYGCRSGLLF